MKSRVNWFCDFFSPTAVSWKTGFEPFLSNVLGMSTWTRFPPQETLARWQTRGSYRLRISESRTRERSFKTYLSGNWAGKASRQATVGEVAQKHAITEQRLKTRHRDPGTGGPCAQWKQRPADLAAAAPSFSVFQRVQLWLGTFLPPDRLLRGRCRAPGAGVRPPPPGQPGHSRRVSTRSPASGGLFPFWLRTADPNRRRGWQRAGTATAGIIPGRQHCCCDSDTSCCTCREPLRASLCPGSRPRGNRRMPLSDGARGRRCLSRHNRLAGLARAAATHQRGDSSAQQRHVGANFFEYL